MLLINPKHPESFWSFRWAVREILPNKRAVNPPLGLATVAALCPPGWNVTIVDENVESIPLAPRADLIGICGMGVQFSRQKELLRFYRHAGYYVVAGGSYASLCPERYEGLADTVVSGEAEYIFPQFCRDFEAGCPRPLYRETGTVSLADSPVPRFDLLRLDAYQAATVQFSRGCPFRCEFCDIIVMFGRRPRTKPLDHVQRELDALRRLGARNVFFVDDNLIGHKREAGALLRRLAEYQRHHGSTLRFWTEASLNLAQDDRLLAGFRDAGFGWVFIGIETPEEASLRETSKTQNLQGDLLGALSRIYAHGIDVLAGFIVGFDNDTEATLERQYRFIQRSGIQAAMVGLLTALPHTPLYDRLAREGRLRPHEEASDNTRPSTNVVPRRMSYEAMVAGYERLYRRLVSDRAIAARIRSKMRQLGSPVSRSEHDLGARLGIVWRLVTKGVLRHGPSRLVHFVRTLPFLAPSRLPIVLGDWITGLAMRDFVDRTFGAGPARRRQAARRGATDGRPVRRGGQGEPVCSPHGPRRPPVAARQSARPVRGHRGTATRAPPGREPPGGDGADRVAAGPRNASGPDAAAVPPRRSRGHCRPRGSVGPRRGGFVGVQSRADGG
jgi:radical SAM superfamily enzyme YgiQ (UPF0313 family)